MKIHYSWAILLITALKSCIFPGWHSSIEFVAASGLVALFMWIESRPKPMSLAESKAYKDLSQLKESQDEVRKEVTGLKMKLGFRPER